MPKQSQQSGDNSVNIQADKLIVNKGLSYQDVKEIALDVFKHNFHQLVGVAAETASQRAEQITNDFLNELKSQNPEGLKSAEDPDFQYALFTAQKGYARVGDDQLGKVLIDILVDRSKEQAQSLLGVVLNESLEVAPKLTHDQIAVLSLVFTLRYTKFLRMQDHYSLIEYIVGRLLPFVDDLPTKESAFQHLEFVKCCSIQISSLTISNIFKNSYPGMFSKGFSKDELDEALGLEKIPRKLISKCLNDASKFQINASDEDIFTQKAKDRNFSDLLTDKILSLHRNTLMSDKEIEDFLISIEPNMKNLIISWNESTIKNLTLTSVGIAIGHSNVKRITGENAPLSIWI